MLNIKFGDLAARLLSGKIGAGSATLASGTVTVAEPGAKATSVIVLTRHEAGGTVTNTTNYVVGTVTAGTGFVINATVAAGTVNTADESTIHWHLINP